MASRLRLARMGAAVLGASVALMVGAALPASADSPNSTTGKVTGFTPGDNVVMDYAQNGPVAPHKADTGLSQLQVNDGTHITNVQTYCVELTVELDSQVGMIEVPWNKYPNPNSPFNKNNTYINWVLHSSYPFNADLAALGKTVDAKTPLTAEQAMAGTQAAIWHYSDDATLDKNQNQEQVHNDPASNANITALYAYLTGSSNTGISQPPAPPADPKVSISPASATGTAPGEIGPFTVSSNFGTPLGVDTSGLPSGAKLTDGKGNAVDLTKFTDGTKFFFDLPSESKAGEASVKVEGDLQIGRLFIGNDENSNEVKSQGLFGNAHTNCNKPTQSLIVAQSSSASATASASYTPGKTTPPTTPPTTRPTTPGPVVGPTSTTPPQVKNTGNGSPLAQTGVDIIAPVVLGVVLIGAGGAFLFLQRRRKRV